MTRTVALGAVLGFAATVLVLAVWDRGGTSGATASVDAGLPPLFIPSALGRATGAPLDRRVERMLVRPTYEPAGSSGDAGAP